MGLIIVWNMVLEWRRRRIAARRTGESICTFARAFERRTVDTWIIRAVYEEFQLEFPAGFPLRPEDRIADDIGCADEDLDEAAENIAHRCGRPLVNTQQNPLYNKVETLRDLVMFLNHQPKASST